MNPQIRLAYGIQKMPPRSPGSQGGKIGWALLWLLGVPLPVLLLVYVLRGCH